ncbi:MAG: TraR/DksA family transcriptional regulator [Verrucomicrobiales bacterium]|nr:TraR/DksA family transcriptional regulator [Verrucomicrobiales bacterium]
MTTEQLNRYRNLLETQLAELSEASRTHEQNLEDNHTSNDFVGPDRAADLENLEVDASVSLSERKLALKISHALDRIKMGTYGNCESCGAAIPATRLDAKPSASLCLRCQEAHEAGH